MLNIDDREVVQQISENVYLQHFVGLSSFQQSAPFDPSLLVTIRKRLGADMMLELNELILEEAGVLDTGKDSSASLNALQNGQGKGNSKDDGLDVASSPAPASDGDAGDESARPVSGTLLIDATVAEQHPEISYLEASGFNWKGQIFNLAALFVIIIFCLTYYVRF